MSGNQVAVDTKTVS